MRVLLVALATSALVAAVWLAVLGRRQATRASALRHANSAAIAHNRTSSAQLSGLTAANSRAQGRVALVDGDRQSTVAGMDSLVRAWNEWLAANNELIGTANRFVDQSIPSGPAVHAQLDARLRTITAKDAAFRAAVVKFAAAAAKARHDLAGTKP
jgi:hypothetical protein